LPVRNAALANGILILIHGPDFDDTHLASIVHATAASLPAALSLAESLDLDGRDMLTAYVAGMEVVIRIGAAVKGGFHHTDFHAFSGGVELSLGDGRRLRKHARINSGAGERALTIEQASAKFCAAAEMILNVDQSSRARDTILSRDGAAYATRRKRCGWI